MSDYGSRGLREGGGNCLMYLKREWKTKEGRETKIFKRGGKLGQRVGALKRMDWNPLLNYGKDNEKNYQADKRFLFIIRLSTCSKMYNKSIQITCIVFNVLFIPSMTLSFNNLTNT